jgi:putative nucleotidyltransferase with HDIG domain
VSAPIGNRWIILAALTVLTGSFNLKVPSINASLSVSDAFVFASILIFGTPAGTATALLECLVVSLRMERHSRAIYRLLFNAAAASISIWIAGGAFYSYSGIAPYSQSFTPLTELFFPFLGFIALYFLLNSSLVALAVSLEQRIRPLSVWWNNFAWLAINYFSGAYVAALIVTYTKQLDFGALAIIVPLVVVSYLTFRTAIGRAEDKYNHLSELNRLYLSTIETLAMAIDAKDQITHGHIRRVQTYAVGLARHMGVVDDKLIKAIEAAALLHDMGKLAVPEHILNKPGKLTAAEFEKMKLHASVGADILSAIDFPYPVVPIVRHHHENWNGRGYPDGIQGTDIPIGARILSVVDCFDALTSDRPYRPRLSDEEAIAILVERRGSMYDPLVVDTFIRVHKSIAPEEQPSISSPQSLSHLSRSNTERVPHLTSQSELVAIASAVLPAGFTGELAKQGDLAGMSTVVARHLGASVPFALLVLFEYDVATDELIAKHTVGDYSELVKGLRIPSGNRLTGWVGANRQCIVDSDPALDLGAITWREKTGLQSSLSVPILDGRDLLGVLTLYSTSHRYDDGDCQLAQAAVACLVHRLGDRSSWSVLANP